MRGFRIRTCSQGGLAPWPSPWAAPPSMPVENPAAVNSSVRPRSRKRACYGRAAGLSTARAIGPACGPSNAPGGSAASRPGSALSARTRESPPDIAISIAGSTTPASGSDAPRGARRAAAGSAPRLASRGVFVSSIAGSTTIGCRQARRRVDEQRQSGHRDE